MRATPEGTSPRAAVTRHFESSRHSGADLAAAFERALPTVRRDTDRDRSPQSKTAPDHPSRTRSAVS
jgi:hypothetical protein